MGGLSECNTENEYYMEKTVVKQLQRPHEIVFSSEEIQKIVTVYHSGKTDQELSLEYKFGKATIIKLLKQQGVDVRIDKARTKIDEDPVIDMYQQMQTAKQIAKHFKVSKQVILECLHEYGVKLRTRWDYPQK